MVRKLDEAINNTTCMKNAKSWLESALAKPTTKHCQQFDVSVTLDQILPAYLSKSVVPLSVNEL
jgi:hypothetical protein